jgi:CHAD domain-containing protein
LRRYGISLERRLRRTGTTWKLVLPRGETVVAKGEMLPAHVVSLLGCVVGERPLEAVPWYREDPDFARLEAYVAEQRDAMLAHEPGVRLGADPENLHQHRVAARRLRAALRTGRRLVDHGWSESLRRELGALGRVTGPLRDLDVLLEWLEEERRRLPTADAEGGEALTAELEARRVNLQEELLSILDGQGYRGLLATLEQPVAPAPAAARRTLRDRVARDVSRLIADVQSAGRRPGTETLHELRLAVKRVRYSVELAGAGGGSRAARLTAAARELQDILGAYQDTVSAEELLRAQAIRSRNGALAFAAGTLTARQLVTRKRLARDLPAAWKQLRRAARSS